MKKTFLFIVLSMFLLTVTNCSKEENFDDSSGVSSKYSSFKTPNEQQKKLNLQFPLNDYRRIEGENMITIMVNKIETNGAISGYSYFVNDRKNENGKFYQQEYSWFLANYDGKLLYIYNQGEELTLVLELKYSSSCVECTDKTPYLVLHQSTPIKDKIPYLMNFTKIGIW